MALTITPLPAHPECDGNQWTVAEQDKLATIVGVVLVGRAKHASKVLLGAQHTPMPTKDELKEQLKKQLVTPPGPRTHHRDGLLFEIICWVALNLTSNSNELISDPHLSSTTQGVDTLSIEFDPLTRKINRATVYEQKCTEHPRSKFQQEVLKAFREWHSGQRDNQLTSIATALVAKHNLTDDENNLLFDTLVNQRPLSFQAALTVEPTVYDAAQCVKLFKDFSLIAAPLSARIGNTFPNLDTRVWFNSFADSVWKKIESDNV